MQDKNAATKVNRDLEKRRGLPRCLGQAGAFKVRADRCPWEAGRHFLRGGNLWWKAARGSLRRGQVVIPVGREESSGRLKCCVGNATLALRGTTGDKRHLVDRGGYQLSRDVASGGDGRTNKNRSCLSGSRLRSPSGIVELQRADVAMYGDRQLARMNVGWGVAEP